MDEHFRTRAKKVFAQFADPYEKALLDAEMMWLACRGDERYVQVYLGRQAGLESAWQFFQYTEVPLLVERYKHVEVRPVDPPFADHILASLAVLLQHLVTAQRGVRVYMFSSEHGDDGLERDVAAGEAFKQAKEGHEVVADWRGEGVLKTRSVMLSRDRFLFIDYRSGYRRSNARGFVYWVKKSERDATRRIQRHYLGRAR